MEIRAAKFGRKAKPLGVDVDSFESSSKKPKKIRR